MTVFTPEALQALAEALAPATKQLAAGLLRRPLPQNGAAPADPGELARQMADLHAQALPALREALDGLDGLDADDAEEAAEDLCDPLFALVEGARAVHSAPLPPEAEALRPYLAALAEDAATDGLEILLLILQAALDPWGTCDDAEHPALDPALKPDAPAHLEALLGLCRGRPGILSESDLARLVQTFDPDV